jgi:hypothetical protein
VCTGFKWLKTDATEYGNETLGSINDWKLLDKLATISHVTLSRIRWTCESIHVTNSTEQTPAGEDDDSSCDQEMSRHLWNSNVYCRVQQSLLPDPIQSHFKSSHHYILVFSDSYWYYPMFPKRSLVSSMRATYPVCPIFLDFTQLFHLGTAQVDGMLRCRREPTFLRKVSILERNTGQHIVMCISDYRRGLDW